MSEFWQGLKCGFGAGMLQNMFGGCMPFCGFNPWRFNSMPIFGMPMFNVPMNTGNFYQYSQPSTLFMPDLNSISITPNESVFSGFTAPMNWSFNAGFDTYTPTKKTETTTVSVNDTKKPSKKSSSASHNENAYDDLINKYAEKFGVEPAFAKAVIKQESRFNPNAKSSAGAKGLMQLMPRTAGSYGVNDPYNPEQNIRGGIKMLSILSKKYKGDKKMILAAYNWGEGNLDKKGFDARPKQTREYIPLVLGYYNEYKTA